MRLLLCCLLLGTSVLAQTEWRDFSAVARHAMAFDAARNELVRFGGETADRTRRGGTWTATPGGAWTRRTPTTAPPPRMDHAVVHATHLNTTYLFGGQGTTAILGDLWAWQGTDWALVSTPSGPSPRAGHAMGYDPVRQRIVMFGGRTASASLSNETWEFDGSQWTMMQPILRPSPAWLPGAIAFNPVTQRMTLYPGGPDVWEWDGAAWTRILPSTKPTLGVFVGQKLLTSPNGSGVLLIGGEDGSLGIWTAGAFFRWDGTDWSKVPAMRSDATERYHHAIAATPQSVVVHGGVRREEFGFYRTKTTFNWDGIDWAANALEPEGRDDARLIYDPARAQLLLVGGSRGFFPQPDPWARTGRTWTQLPTGPDAFGMGVAFDTQRDVLVTFGGCALSLGGPCQSTKEETWEWNGSAWSHLNPQHHPGERTAPAMAYDPVLQQTILFGGTTQAQAVQTDTWVWDGVDWTQRTPLHAPPAAGPIVYDPSQSGVVMASGGQLWRFDGSDWHAGLALPPVLPKLLVYDTRRDRLVLAGNATYELIAGSWVLREPVARGSGAGYDPALGAIVTFGAGGAWEYGPTVLATTTPLGAGCAGPLGIPGLLAARDPFVGDAWDIQLTNAPTLAWGCIGFDAVTWDNLPLPLELSPFGMPGCTLYQNVARVDPIPAGQWSIAIPAMPTLLGCAVHLQALVITPGLNAAGAVASDALVGVIGGR